MYKILALWAIPRSTSTAFEWMMRQRGDCNCLHEPFGEAWYQGENPMWPRFKKGDKSTPGLSLESTWADIKARANKGPVFIKDFPHYINHIWNADFLSHFTHAFLIRDPAKTISSMYNKWPDFEELEVGFPEQRALFDLLTALNGKSPSVIDSDDLLENPDAIVSAFCNSVGIPFLPKAMSWKAGKDPSAQLGGWRIISRKFSAINRAQASNPSLCRYRGYSRKSAAGPYADETPLQTSIPT